MLDCFVYAEKLVWKFQIIYGGFCPVFLDFLFSFPSLCMLKNLYGNFKFFRGVFAEFFYNLLYCFVNAEKNYALFQIIYGGSEGVFGH